MNTKINNLLSALAIKSSIIWLLSWSVIIYFLFLAPITVRFDYNWLNDLFSTIVILAIPFSLFRLSKYEPKGFLLTSQTILRGMILFPALLFALISFMSMVEAIKTGKSLFDGMFYEYELDGSYYRLYRINPGAMSSYSLSLTKETPFLFLFKLIKPIQAFDPGTTGKIQQIAPDKLRLIWYIGNEDNPENIYDFKT